MAILPSLCFFPWIQFAAYCFIADYASVAWVIPTECDERGEGSEVGPYWPFRPITCLLWGLISDNLFIKLLDVPCLSCIGLKEYETSSPVSGKWERNVFKAWSALRTHPYFALATMDVTESSNVILISCVSCLAGREQCFLEHVWRDVLWTGLISILVCETHTKISLSDVLLFDLVIEAYRPRHFEQNVYKNRIPLPHGEEGPEVILDKVLLSLSAWRKTLLHDSLQPDDAKDIVQRDFQAQGLHKKDIRFHRQEILLRPHSRGQVSVLNPIVRIS